MKADSILRWAVESRNRITKMGDLDTESQCHVVFTNGWTDELTRSFRIKPSAPESAIVPYVLNQISPDVLGEESLICIERRWVDGNLSGSEILQATSHVLLILSDLIRDAHVQIISNVCPDLECELSSKLANFRDTYPLEIANIDDTRKVWIQATNSEKIKFDITGSTFSRKDIEASVDEVAARYGFAKPEENRKTDEDLLAAAIAAFEDVSRKMLEKDGRLYSVIQAMDAGSNRMYQLALAMRTRAEKHLAVRRAALVLEKCDIVWAIMIGEAWASPIRGGESFRHAIDSSKREECISMNAVSASGQFKNKYIMFERRHGKIVFGEEMEDESPVNIMRPILKVIKREPKGPES